MQRANIHQVLPSREYGGAAEVAFCLAQYGKRVGRERTKVWLPARGRAWQKAIEDKLDVHLYQQPDIVSCSRTASLVANVRSGWNWRHNRPGVLHLHSAELYGGLPWACRLADMPRVVHIHLEQEESTIRWAFRSLPELIITCADFLVENVRRFLAPEQQQHGRIVAIPNCVDTTRYRPGDRPAAKAIVGAPQNVPLVLMLANLSPHKGQETAVKAVALLKQQQFPVRCWIAGVDRSDTGAYESQLKALIRELNVEDCVELLGYRTDGADLLRAADVFLLPSTREGLPLSVLEAQASKVPVLAAPTSGIPEVVQDGSTGFLIPAGDAARYASRIAELVRQPAWRDEIVEQAFSQIQERHHADTYCRRMWELYDDLLSQPAGRWRAKVALN